MPRLRKEDVEGTDVEELEEAEYTEGNYVKYDGEIPPNDTILTGYVKAMWWTRTQEKPDGTGDDPMLKVLFVAEENEGDLDEYNGMPAWENMALTKSSKFKWAPFLDHFGITIREILTDRKVTVAAEDDGDRGAPIESIGSVKFVPGSDESWCRILVSRERYNERWQAHVAGWLDYEESEDTEEEPEEPEEPEEEEAEEEEAEPEPEPAPATRGRRTTAPAASKGPRTAAKPTKTPAATSTRPAPRRSATARSEPAKTAPARRGRRSPAADAEPPF